MQNLFNIQNISYLIFLKKLWNAPGFTKDEEDEEAEEEDIAEHGERVQGQHHQDPHT